MTDDEIIEVVQAHKEGKKVQAKRSVYDAIWVDVHDNKPEWDFHGCEYRVAPEPRKPRECELYFRNGFPEILNFKGDPPVNGTSIHVREILE